MSILIVEDDLHVRELLTKGLSLGGHEVHSASNGQEAFEVLARITRPSLILLDLMMPIMNGWQFAEEMTRRHPHLDIPIIVISAFEANSKSPAGIRKYLRKPITLTDLLTTVEEYCLSRPDPHDRATVRFRFS